MIEDIVTMKEFIAIVTTPWFIFLEFISVLAIIVFLVFIYKDFFTKSENKNNDLLIVDLSKRRIEFEEEEEMSIEDILKYFRDTYNFDIGGDSIKIINKAQGYLDKLNEYYKEARLTLFSVELGVCKKEKAISLLNNCGGYMILSSHELDIMFKLFSHLFESDTSYQDELWTINKIRTESKVVEKKLINVCLVLISECQDC